MQKVLDLAPLVPSSQMPKSQRHTFHMMAKFLRTSLNESNFHFEHATGCRQNVMHQNAHLDLSDTVVPEENTPWHSSMTRHFQVENALL